MKSKTKKRQSHIAHYTFTFIRVTNAEHTIRPEPTGGIRPFPFDVPGNCRPGEMTEYTTILHMSGH